MSDVSEIAAMGGTGAAALGLLGAFLKWSGGRNVAEIDRKLDLLALKIEELSKSWHEQREKNVGTEKDLDVLKERVAVIEQRLESTGKFWANQFEEQRRITHQRLEQATLDLIQAIEAVKSFQPRRRR